MEDPFDVRERVIIVTGASSGIGEWIARGLDRAGARVVLTARRLQRLEAIAAELQTALPVVCDLAVESQRANLVQRTLEEFGRVDGLVNNAAILPVMPATRESNDEFRHVLEVNLVAPFDLSKRCLDSFRSHGGGSIVNVTSVSALISTGTIIPSAGYCAAKAGLAHLTRELAAQWGRHNVRVNAIAPGFFLTEMTEVSERTELGVPPWIEDRLAICRPGGRGDAEHVVRFLLSEASRYVTGQQIAVDGGYTAS